MGAAQTPEKISGLGLKSFESLGKFKPVALKRREHVRLSGDIRLSGSTYVRDGQTYLRVRLSGSTNIRGDRLNIQSGYTTVNVSESIWLRGSSSYVSAYVRPNVRVSLYKDGRYIGSTYVSGNIRVSGWKNGSWLRLSGYGTLRGDIWIEVKDEKDKS